MEGDNLRVAASGFRTCRACEKIRLVERQRKRDLPKAAVPFDKGIIVPGYPKTAAEIGAEIGESRQCVEQIIERALTKLRWQGRKLEEFLEPEKEKAPAVNRGFPKLGEV